ncbi:MAG: HD domain-containing protein [Pseudomonadota bacterium]
MSIGAAFELALAAHAGQTDKSGEPYIAHVVRVAAGVEGTDAIIIALLHDVVEDTDVSLETVADRFGPKIAAAVDALSKRGNEPLEDYMSRVRADPVALSVKLSDLADNGSPARLARLDAATRSRLETKYAKALKLLS